jgi:hypothetical protein
VRQRIGNGVKHDAQCMLYSRPAARDRWPERHSATE